mmetsp:Transcript_1395/g.5301  ORF Transcript_1395/g.5301 Transcript_1395/m.5301 type:complete len:201 (+) Transcript_1395:232-834(+)
MHGHGTRREGHRRGRHSSGTSTGNSRRGPSVATRVPRALGRRRGAVLLSIPKPNLRLLRRVRVVRRGASRWDLVRAALVAGVDTDHHGPAPSRHCAVRHPFRRVPLHQKRDVAGLERAGEERTRSEGQYNSSKARDNHGLLFAIRLDVLATAVARAVRELSSGRSGTNRLRRPVSAMVWVSFGNRRGPPEERVQKKRPQK